MAATMNPSVEINPVYEGFEAHPELREVAEAATSTLRAMLDDLGGHLLNVYGGPIRVKWGLATDPAGAELLLLRLTQDNDSVTTVASPADLSGRRLEATLRRFFGNLLSSRMRRIVAEWSTEQTVSRAD